jgi:hypothetical protein
MTEVKISKTIERPENMSYLAWVNYVQTELMKTQEKKKLPPLTKIQNPYCPITHSKTAPSRN